MNKSPSTQEAIDFLYKHGDLTYSACHSAILLLTRNGFIISRAAPTPAPVPEAEAHKRGVEAADSLAKRIVQGVCELQHIPDPEHPDTLMVTIDDLEAVIVNKLEASGAVLCDAQPVAWVNWQGGDFMPIPGEMRVTVLLRDGSIEGPAFAREFGGPDSCWKHRGSDGDIVAYSTACATRSPSTPEGE